MYPSKRVFEAKLSDGSVIATGDYQQCTQAVRRMYPESVADWDWLENAVYYFGDTQRAVAVVCVVPQEVKP